MAFNIVWTEKAEESFDKIIEYLSLKWSKQSAAKFVQKTFKLLTLIENNPLSFQKSEKENIRQVLITKQTYLFYEILNNNIHLLIFWDNRQNPANLLTNLE